MGYKPYNKGGIVIKKFDVDFYTKENGVCPVCEFLDSLEEKMRAKLLRLVLLLERNGNELREPYSKKVVDGIFEIRAKQGNSITRVLYFFVSGRKIILTNGFVKKTLQTPKKEIALAMKYRKDYFERKGEENE